MRLSRYFLPVLKEVPAEAEIVSHQLMLRAGMIQQLQAGIYNWLPLGWNVLQKVEQIVREEQNRAGAIEILMPTIQPASLWRESGRYDAYGKEMLRIKDRGEREMLFGPTNEENVTDIFRKHVRSYRQLPLNLYHIQWKFRDEVRPRFGVMRGREFLMKDAYSFDLDIEAGAAAFDRMFVAYLKTFKRMGLTAIPMRAESGPIGGNMSYEFQILAQTGESAVYFDQAFEEIDFSADDLDVAHLKQLYAAADELHDPANCPVPPERLRSGRGIEVGHIFFFGTKYSAPMGATVLGPDGKEVPVEMGSYGIGVSRLVGALIEANHDEKGIVWPESVAPFRVGLINLRADDELCRGVADDLYAKLEAAKVEVLYDDREERAGAKFATMDLIGLPWQVTVGPRGAKAGTVELKSRRTGAVEELSVDALLARFAA
ncbi:MAG TPA: proline--tRNA ligase [Geminicoccus sp.]|uniref:proline--tRNA ligase n=1 Tax=Geminicoccus sp. TaxID=2024832 RepID=UPI002CC345E7|nr:proline--tRNA ligase [Geminicoccus sp.]HWL67153.1 proline--tRNA ligase [Geminicoccus sp.]